MWKILINKYFWITVTSLVLIGGFMFSQDVSRQFISSLQTVLPVLKSEGVSSNELTLTKGAKIKDAINYDVGCMTWDKSGQGKQNIQTERCFYLVDVLKREGANSVLKLFVSLYEEDQNFEISSCHLYTHSIGVAVFHEFGEGALSVDMFVSMPVMPARCAIKTYHGFFQEFLKDVAVDKRLLKEARTYCNKVEKDSLDIRHNLLRNEIPMHCMMGTGYGILYSHAKNGYQEKEAINAALSDCEIFSDKKSFYIPCISGVYEGISMLYLAIASDELSWNLPQDPFASCRDEESIERKNICFLQLRSLAWTLTPDLKRVSSLLERVQEDISTMMMYEFSIAAAAYFIGEKNYNNEQILSECRKVENENFQNICVGANGYRIAKFRSGTEAVAFCEQEDISVKEKDNCFRELVSSFFNNYSKEESDDLCVLLYQPYQSDCDNLR